MLVLMYHSISNEIGPTCMPPKTFGEQLSALRECGYRILDLAELRDWLEGGAEAQDRCAAITFDDAFRDFADEAAPALAAHGFRAAVFVPTGFIGSSSIWEGEVRRPLLTWSQIRELAAAGFEFGSHSHRHVDLTKLAPQELTEELTRSSQELEAQLSSPTRYFAAPFGKVDPVVQRAIKEHYDISFGVRLGRLGRGVDPFDVPRIEMHYFRDISRWRAFLEGRAEGYFALRKFARSLRAVATK